MARRKRSSVWEFFVKEGEKSVKCTLCNTILTYHGGTSSMRSHLSGKHDRMITVNHDSTTSSDSSCSSQSSMDSFVGVKRKCSSDRATKVTKLVCEMVARDLRPVSIVEGDGFKRLINYLEPEYRVPSHTHITSVCHRMYQVEREKLEVELVDRHVGLTSDIWTSAATQGYITVTAHFISDDWKFCSWVLLTREMGERHTGINISERLLGAAKEWGITDEHVSGLVRDNAANAVLGADLTGWPHFGCAAHTLQLSVNGGLAHPTTDKAIATARKLVSHFKHSVVATTALKEKQEQLNIKQHHLIQDVSTRWNSTFFMIDRLVEQRVAIYAVLHDATVSKDQYQHLDLKEDQWVLLEQLTKVLEPLQMATTVFSYEVNTSSSIIYPVLHGLIRNHLKINDKDVPAVKHFKNQVSQDLTERFEIDEEYTASSIPFLCTAVDPRYSSLKFATSEQRSTAHEAILQHLKESHFQSSATEENEGEASEAATQKKTALEILLGDISSKSSALTPEVELESFAKEVEGSDTNPLVWWKTNQGRYPHLSKLAKQLLCIPATSVPSERVFSVSGTITSAKRNCIKPENVDMLIFLNKNLPKL